MTTFLRPEQRDPERAEIERQLAEWLNAGNTIKQAPVGATGQRGGRMNITVNQKADCRISRRGGAQ